MNYIHKLKFTQQSLTSTHVDEDGNELTTSFIKDAKQIAEEVLRSIADKTVIRTIVHIGTITKPATFDEYGNELTAAYEVEGYHVDVLASEVIPELVPFCLTEIPSTPVHGNGWAENEYEIVLNRAA